MSSLRSRFATPSVVLDSREGIGPHHLAIGKTRKLFEHGGIVHAFYSTGYAIAYARLEAGGLTLLDTAQLDLPVAWGGGAFCLDDDGAGGVCLVFLHRNQHELCAARGTIAEGRVRFDGWRTLLVSGARQAAPWVEMGPGGTAWASVLDRDGDFRLAVLPARGEPLVGDLFAPGEARWYHSCVQMLPVGPDTALAVGFRGDFPSKTELVFKTVTATLALGEAETLAPCNVNDHLTFHFQAVGDAERGRAHVALLDEGLSVSHALYEGGRRTVFKGVLPGPCYAPQICRSEAGGLALLAADYEGGLWTAAWDGVWSKPRRVADVAGPNLSARFGLTGYGTGGLICAARSSTGRVPYLFGRIEDEAAARAGLHVAALGQGEGLSLASREALAVRVAEGRVEAEIRLAWLGAADAGKAGHRWCVTIPAEAGRALMLVLAGGPKGISGSAHWLERDGCVVADAAPPQVGTQFHDAFSCETTCGALHIAIEPKRGTDGLQPGKAWVETGRVEGADGVQLVDLADYVPETAALLAVDSSRIPATFRRMV